MKKDNTETSVEVVYDMTAVLLKIQAFWHITLCHWTGGSRHSERTAVPSSSQCQQPSWIVWPWRWRHYNPCSGGKYTPNKMASHPRRTLNFWENYLENVAYCKPHISTEYHSNTKIFQNHLPLAFQYLTLFILISVLSPHLFMSFIFLYQQLCFWGAFCNNIVVIRHKSVWRCVLLHVLPLHGLVATEQRFTANRWLHHQGRSHGVENNLLTDRRTRLEHNKQQGWCGLSSYYLWPSIYHITWHHTSLPWEHQMSHGLVNQHLAFATAQLKQSDPCKWKCFLNTFRTGGVI